MKKSILLVALGFATIGGFAQKDKKAQDIAAIKQMCGCYEVTFDFGETFSPDKEYQFKDNYHSGGLEWVQLVEEAQDKVVLQHLLIADESNIIKHWRQDWLYENTSFYMFDHDNKWKYVQLAKKEVTGQWTQQVFQVDDSPRYQGTATWIHADGRHFWENTTDSPLPRREYTKRSDYNVMKRRNRHEITSYGWLHEQDNDKVLRDGKTDKLIAQEKGWNAYKKVDDKRCKAAQDWWKKNASFWAEVRKTWDEVFAQNKDLELAKDLEEKPLYMHIFALKPEETNEAKKVIKKFVK